MPKLQLLGGFSLTSDSGQPIILPRKARALIACLALHNRPTPRERLSAWLWEDSAEEQARASLRQALAAIRRAVSPPMVLADAENCALSTALEIDVHQFESAADPVGRARLFTGDYLEGAVIQGATLSALLAAERARLRDAGIRAITEAAEQALAERRHESALELGQRLSALDPLHEPGQRLLMRAYAETGRIAEAQRQYRQLQDLLRRELQASPEPATVAVANELGRKRREPAPPSTPEDEPPQPRRELRRMGVLSIGIAGLSALATSVDIEALEQLSAAAHAIIDEEARCAGGYVLERQSDVVTLIFGAETAHDDDPLRAACAAEAIHCRFSAEARKMQSPLSVSIGLACGPLLLIEQEATRTAFGEALSLAAQLRARAEPGTTLAPGTLLHELDGHFSSEPRHDAHRLFPAENGAAPAIPLMGRAAEIAQIEALLESSETDGGRMLLIRGEAGIGKTRLVETAMESARKRGWKSYRSVIADFGELASITPRRQLVLAMLGIDPCGALPDRLSDHPLAQGLKPENIPILYQLAGGLAPGKAARRTATPGWERAMETRDRVFGHLLFTAAAQAPHLIIVEDAHWASEEMLQQIRNMTRVLSEIRTLFIVTTRPHPDHFGQSFRVGSGPFSTLDLGPLGKAASRGVAQALGIDDTAEADALAERAQGNPLYLRQLAAVVADGTPIGEALPGSVQGVALGRMDALTEAEKTALRTAAILGPRSEIEAVRFISGHASWSPSAAALGALIRFDGHSLFFTHALIRDAILHIITPSDKRRLHSQAALWYAGRSPELHARHLQRAGDTAAAAAAWADAAGHALTLHRADKALAHVRHGLEDAGAAADRFRLHLTASRARLRTMDWHGALKSAREAGAVAPDIAAKVSSLIAEADACIAGQRADEALTLLDAAAALAEPAGLAPAMARIHGLKGNIHFPAGRLDECLADHGAALEWSRRAGSPIAEAGALAGMAWAHYQRGVFREACAHADQCLGLAETPAFDRIRLSALRVRSVSRIFLLQHEGALADARETIRLAAEQGDHVNEILACTTAGTVMLEYGDLASALAMGEQALALALQHEGVGIEAAPLWVMGTAYGVGGDHTTAREMLARACEAGRNSPSLRFSVPRILGTLAFFTEPEAMPALFAEAQEILAERPAAHSANAFYGCALHAALRHADHEMAERCVQGLKSHMLAEAEPWVEAMLAFARDFTALSRGEPDALPAAAQLHARAREQPALNWLRPTMKLVEERVGARASAR